MNTGKTGIVLVLACVLLAPALGAQAAAPAQAPASTVSPTPAQTQLFNQLDPIYEKICKADWSSTATNNVAQLQLKQDEIARFLDMLHSRWGIVAQKPEDYPSASTLNRATVGDFKFIDLDGDGTLELVATADYSHKGEQDDVFVIRRTQDHYRFEYQQLSTYFARSIDAIAIDVDNDGKYEMVLERLLTSNNWSGEPQVSYPVVYELNKGGQYEDKTSNHSAYYQNVLIPQLTQFIQNRTANGAKPDELELLQMRLDKMQRLTGSAFAGLLDADWKSGIPVARTQLLAIAVLRDIALETCGPNLATQDLFKLATGRVTPADGRVSFDAQRAMQDLRLVCP
jgi:hypothetical protein